MDLPVGWEIVETKDSQYGLPQFDIVIPCATNELAEAYAKTILENEQKRKQFDWLIAYLRTTMSKEDLDLMSVIIDEECRKILAYLVSTES